MLPNSLGVYAALYTHIITLITIIAIITRSTTIIARRNRACKPAGTNPWRHLRSHRLRIGGRPGYTDKRSQGTPLAVLSQPLDQLFTFSIHITPPRHLKSILMQVQQNGSLSIHN